MAADGKQTVAVDFDGVLHSYTHGYDPERLDLPEPGALEFVEGLLEAGYSVTVHSTRSADQEGFRGMARWLRQYGFPMDHDRMSISVGPKPPAVAYVDDRAVAYDRTTVRPWDSVRTSVDWLAVQGPHCGQTAS